MLLTNEWVNNQFEVEIKRYFETNENEHIMTQNLWDIAKAVLKGKFIVIQTHLKKQDKSQVITLKKLEKEKQIKLKVRIGREITKRKTTPVSWLKQPQPPAPDLRGGDVDPNP